VECHLFRPEKCVLAQLWLAHSSRFFSLNLRYPGPRFRQAVRPPALTHVAEEDRLSWFRLPFRKNYISPLVSTKEKVHKA